MLIRGHERRPVKICPEIRPPTTTEAAIPAQRSKYTMEGYFGWGNIM